MHACAYSYTLYLPVISVAIVDRGNVRTDDETVAWLVVKGSKGEAVVKGSNGEAVKDRNVEASTAHAV